ncbi:hypothetical protein ACHAWF_001833 [Thalassiosira exigua]
MDPPTKFNGGRCKRKSPCDEDAAEAYASASVDPPRFASRKMMRTRTPIAATTTAGSAGAPGPVAPSSSSPKPPSLSNLPMELFCQVVAHLGPTSSSLCALARTTKQHNAAMTTIGDVMLARAKLRFRAPLPPMIPRESSVSLFVRHARASKAVHDQLLIVERALAKEFPAADSAHPPEDDVKLLPRRPDAPRAVVEPHEAKRAVVEPHEAKRALNVALCLLGRPRGRYFPRNPAEAEEIARNASTTALEWRVDALCRTLGAKAYKFAKGRMCRRRCEDDAALYFGHARNDSGYYAVMDEMAGMGSDDFDDDDDDDDGSVGSVDSADSILSESDEDAALLDKACLVMQHVVMRENDRMLSRRAFAAAAAGRTSRRAAVAGRAEVEPASSLGFRKRRGAEGPAYAVA